MKRWRALGLAVLFAGCTVQPAEQEEEEPDYIGPCIAYREDAIVLPAAGCFRVDVPEGSLGRVGTHPCEANWYCVIVEYDGSGDSGLSWFHDNDGVGAAGPMGPTVTPAQCGSRC